MAAPEVINPWVPPNTSGIDPAHPTDKIVLMRVIARISRPPAWNPADSLTLVAYQHSPDGEPDTLRPRCPVADPAVLDAMGRAGKQPLLGNVEKDHPADGWVAFRIPRDSMALQLRIVHRDQNGGFGWSSFPMTAGSPR